MWKAVFPEGEVDFDNLSPAAFEDIAKREDDATWWTVYTFPGGSPSRLHAVLSVAAAHIGAKVPDAPATMRDARALLEYIERTPDVEDGVFIDGNPPTPEAPETDSSTGLSGVSDGLQVSSVESPSET